jgi:MgtC family
MAVDGTRVIQGVVTGVGFLGAGVIVRDGPSTSGLTTAASIWAASAVGVPFGVGFYAAALLIALTFSPAGLRRRAGDRSGQSGVYCSKYPSRNAPRSRRPATPPATLPPRNADDPRARQWEGGARDRRD